MLFNHFCKGECDDDIYNSIMVYLLTIIMMLLLYLQVFVAFLTLMESITSVPICCMVITLTQHQVLEYTAFLIQEFERELSFNELTAFMSLPLYR